MPIPKTTIAIVDDNQQLLSTISRNMSMYEEIEISFTARNGKELLQKLEEEKLPQVILMDIEMPQMNGIQACYEVQRRFGSDIKILILTVFDQNDKIFDAIQAGASGYLMKDEKPLMVLNAIHEVMAGGSPMSSAVATKTLALLRERPNPQNVENTISPQDFNLTKREIEILQLIAQGQSYRPIAELLFVSEKTIKKHIENIYTKLHVNSKFEAMRLAQRYQWVEVN